MNSENAEVEIDRRADSDRREDNDRRKEQVPVATDQRTTKRRKVQRRRQIDPTTCERDYSEDEIEFMRALDEYKRANGRMFPTCSEILEVIRALGYQRVMDESDDDPAVEANDAESESEPSAVEAEGDNCEPAELTLETPPEETAMMA